MKLAPYPDYKDSGVLWLGKIPAHWDCLPHRAVFSEVKDQGHIDEPLLSVTITKGIIPQSQLLANSSKKDSSNLDKSKYKLVCPNDIAYNKMRAWQGAIGVSMYRGIVSPAYIVVRLRRPDNPNYFHYLLRTPSFTKEAERWSYGITPDMWSLRPEHFKLIYSCIPQNEEQTQIARFLNWKTAQINKFIRNKRRLIELLKEQKQNVINQAVTRGLDPKVQFKPSGVEWIGDIPEHWEVRRLKFLARIRNGQDYKEVEAESGYPVMGSGGQFAYSSAFMYEGESVLFGRKGTIDKPLYINGRFWTVDTMFYTEVSKLVSAKFLYFSALSFPFDYYSTKTALPSMTQQDLGNHPVALPPRDEQELIIQYIEEESQLIDQAITRAQREIELMREYRTRLISDVVTGQVDVRGIEVPDVAEDELLAMEEDTADADDVIDDEGEMDETD
jgi:type I restriction enzyme S subunit